MRKRCSQPECLSFTSRRGVCEKHYRRLMACSPAVLPASRNMTDSCRCGRDKLVARNECGRCAALHDLRRNYNRTYEAERQKRIALPRNPWAHGGTRKPQDEIEFAEKRRIDRLIKKIDEMHAKEGRRGEEGAEEERQPTKIAAAG